MLGLVFLAVTGAEALYADLGHFGRKPIQAAWFTLVLPALLLNYFGQGALVLAHPDALENPFYLLYPDWALIPMVILATLATIIASQAVITGAFSLTRQAIQLGLLPRFGITHTSESDGRARSTCRASTGCCSSACCSSSSPFRCSIEPRFRLRRRRSPPRWSSTRCIAFFVVWRYWKLAAVAGGADR